MRTLKVLFVFIASTCTLSACSSVKAYEKNKLNDSEMELAARKAEKFEQNFQLYREGSSGANGGKGGGG